MDVLGLMAHALARSLGFNTYQRFLYILKWKNSLNNSHC
jgi:hypothetical protein